MLFVVCFVDCVTSTRVCDVNTHKYYFNKALYENIRKNLQEVDWQEFYGKTTAKMYGRHPELSNEKLFLK